MTTPRSAVDRAQAIRELAFRLWEERGCPQGAPDEDWYQAELMIDREPAPDQENEEPLDSARREIQQTPMQRCSSVWQP